jgi:hypothetical protein
MLARDGLPLPRSFVAGAPSPSRKLEGDKAVPYPLDLNVQNGLPHQLLATEQPSNRASTT